MKKKVMVLFIGLLALFLMVACGEDNGDENGEAENGTEVVEGGEEESEEVPPGEVTEISWIVIGEEPTDIGMVQDYVNEYLETNHGLRINISYIGYGDYDQNLLVRINAGEQIDIVYTSGWALNYVQNVRSGNFLNLSPLLDSQFTTLRDSMSPIIRDAVSVDGNIYAIPTRGGGLASGRHWILNAHYVDAHDIPVDEISTFEDIRYWANFIAEAENMENPLLVSGWHFVNTTSFELFMDPLGIDLLGDPYTIVSKFDTPHYLENLASIRQMYLDGLIIAETPDHDTAGYAVALEGRGWFATTALMTPMQHNIVEENHFAQIYTVPMHQFVVTTASAAGNKVAVGAQSAHPEEVLRLLEIMNTSAFLINTISFGIEGHHWYLNADDRVAFTEERANYAPTLWPWGFDTSLRHLRYDDMEDFDAVAAEFNAGLITSPALGFHFDTENVMPELASIANVLDEFQQTLTGGLVDVDSHLATMNERLEAAGIEAVREEMQRQFDEWRAATQ